MTETLLRDKPVEVLDEASILRGLLRLLGEFIDFGLVEQTLRKLMRRLWHLLLRSHCPVVISLPHLHVHLRG